MIYLFWNIVLVLFAFAFAIGIFFGHYMKGKKP